MIKRLQKLMGIKQDVQNNAEEILSQGKEYIDKGKNLAEQATKSVQKFKQESMERIEKASSHLDSMKDHAKELITDAKQLVQGDASDRITPTTGSTNNTKSTGEQDHVNASTKRSTATISPKKGQKKATK